MTKEQKCRESQLGRKTIHLDNKELKVYPDELDEYLKQGWQLGYSLNHKKVLSEKHKGKPSPTKGVNCSESKKKKISETLKRRPKEDSNYGWKKYWKEDHNSWNKGLTKATDSRVAKISKSKLGHIVTEDTRKKLSETHKGKKVPKDKLEIVLSKQYITKKLNNSFNTSKPEELFYKTLLELNKNKTIYRQYKDDRYPFYCDFYIKELDLFIELNYHWTHGGKPFIEDDDCLKTLNEWKEKAKTSKFYENAIEVWTRRDVKKREIARKNNLNFIEIFNEKDIENLLLKLK